MHIEIEHGSGGEGLYASTSDFTLSDSTIEDNGEEGINLSSGDGYLFENVTVKNNGTYGIYTTGMGNNSLTLRNSTISNNAVAARLPLNSVLENNNWTS